MESTIEPAHRGNDTQARFPISVKGVIFISGKIALLKNERDEWELPGGRLEMGESPRQCVKRELEEELNVQVIVGHIIDSWLYRIHDAKSVVIITYFCFLTDANANPEKSDEHNDLFLAPLEKIGNLRMPEHYKRSILNAAAVNGLCGLK